MKTLSSRILQHRTCTRIFILLLASCLIFITGPVAAQGKIALRVSELRQKGVFRKIFSPFTIAPNPPGSMVSRAVSHSTLLDVNDARAEILSSKPDFMEMNVPVENGARVLKLLLYKVDISPNGFNLIASDGQQLGADNHIVNYRGSISNDGRSVAAITFSDHEVMGVISNDEGNYVLGRLQNDNSGRHIIYKDADLLKKFDFNCSTNTSSSAINHNESATSANRATETTSNPKCVNWYWETDYDVFVNKGSLAAVNTYIQGIFNQVSTLYANDGLSITLKTLYIWTTPDPYVGPTTNDYLTQFGAYRTSFNGDLANLIGYAGSGGIAWIGGFCSSPPYEMAYTGISSSYNTVPTYSWTVEVVAHEEGHLFGSRHTHDCAWNGNNTRIDSCGDYAGYSSCGTLPSPIRLPVGGGTIMSYCHLTSVGINFNLGFGPQPLNVMTTGVNNATCLTACTGGCTLPVQPGAISGNSTSCSSTSQTYSVTAVSGATSYTWTLPPTGGWTGSSTTNSITTTTGTTGGTISVKANNACGSGPTQTLAVSITAVPAQPGAITGTASVCSGSSSTYSITAVSGATSYTWTLPSGWTGVSTTNSITATAGASGGSITVKANNSCGSSAAQTLAVSITAIPAQPGAITGSASVCSSTSATYSITAVSGATSYTWTLPSGWTGSSTTNSISTTTGSAGGTVTVKANNSCGSSAAQTLAVAITAVPAQPGAITGSASVCAASSVTYSISAVGGATSYTWTLPVGWVGSSTTTSITATVGALGGTITVKANNGCGSSAAQTLVVSVNAIPPLPGIISGSNLVCPGSSQTYSIVLIGGATSYNWTIPAGWTGSSTTNSITVTTGSSGGTISVSASNACGTSSSQTLAISISSSAPSQPGAITGSSSVCPNSSITYSVASVSGATSYNWTLPAGWIGSSTTNSITVTTGSSGGTISVSASNSCGTSSSQTLAVSIGSSAPSQPGAITGSSSVCPNSSATYSVASVSGATSYTWTLPAGWTGSSTTNSITITTGSSGGTISVSASNSCGTSSSQSLAVSIGSSAPSQPGAITGSSSVCPNSSATYSVTSVSGATSYNWTLPAGWTGSSTTNSITVTTGSSGGTISVSASNSCGTSSSQTLAVSTGSSAPAQPGAIAGSSSVCPNSSATYSVALVIGATSYNWTLPAGWTGSSTTNSITVTTGSSGGTISVSASNGCGTSASTTLSISVSSIPPAQPPVINGPSSSCSGSTVTYSVDPVAGATEYYWSIPNNWSGFSLSNSITVLIGATGGTVSVSAANSCAIGPSQSLVVSIGSSAPSQPGAITGSNSVCPNSSVTYSVAAVSGATSYNWTMPAGWSGSSTTNSITLTTNASGGTISVSASNSCGTSSSQILAVSVGSSGPAQPGAISGNIAVCANNTETYSISAISGASDYTWTIPSGWAGSSVMNTITVTTGANGGTISVVANSSCGSSAPSALDVSTNGSGAYQPGPISGNTAICQNTAQTYSVSAVAGATSYTWILPAGWVGSSSSNSISVTAGTVGGNITVSTNSNCGSSSSQSLAVSVSSNPATPVAITVSGGTANVCPGDTRVYTTPLVAGCSYTWTPPTGGIILNGQGTNSISMSFNSSFTTSGTLSVKATNPCGTSTSKSLTISRNIPSAPGVITESGGSAKVCPGDLRTFSVNPNPDVSFAWTVPTGASISSGQGTNSIVVVFGDGFTSSGTVRVTANNSCGTSVSNSLTVSRNTPATPGSITESGGTAKVCPGDSRTFTVPLVSDVSYNWTAPTGGNIVSGQGTNSVMITFDNNFVATGTLKVTASNACGTSTARTLNISQNTPAIPGSITGPTSVTCNTVVTYSIAAVASANSYTWTLPVGASIVGPQNNTSINVQWGTTGGTLSVKAVNSCGPSGARSISVAMTCTGPLEGMVAPQGMNALIFPNPTDGNFTLRFNSNADALFQITVTDISGRVLRSESYQAVEGINLRKFDLSNFAQGIYLVRLKKGESVQVIKVMVE